MRGDNRAEIEREVACHPGVGIRWEVRGRHIAAVLSLGAAKRTVFMSRTCSDARGLANQRADVRRAIRELRGN